MKINIIVSSPIATYKDKKHHKHQIVGVGLDKACPNNFKIVGTIDCKKQVYIALQEHLFMFGDLNGNRLNDIVSYIDKLDVMTLSDDFEHLYFDTFSKLRKFNYKQIRTEIEQSKHHVLDFRSIYYFVRNAVNS